MRVMFLHGLESDPIGQKSKALLEVYPDLIIPDMRGCSTEQRLRVALAHLTEPTVLVGSSMGGLIAAQLNQLVPDLVRGMVLLVPAFVRSTEPIQKTHPNAVVVVAQYDEIEGLNTAAMQFCADTKTPYHIVPDTHRLSNTMPLILSLTKEIVAKAH